MRRFCVPIKVYSFIRSAALAGLFAATTGCGSDLGQVDVRRPDSPPVPILITHVAVLDVESGDRLIDRDVLLNDGLIAAIGASGTIQVPDEVKILNANGATLLPGLIDMHGHINVDSAPLWAAGFPDHAANLQSYLYCGVTTIFDPADSSADAVERRAKVASGELIGPRIFTAGPALTADEGHPIALVRALAPWWIAWFIAPRVAIATGTVAAARNNVDTLVGKGVDFIKIIIDEIPLGSPIMTPEVAAAIVDQAKQNGLRVVAHIGTTEDAINAAKAGVAAWVHGVYKERIADEQIVTLASYNIPVIATIEVFNRYGRPSNAPRPSTRLERETVSRKILDSFFPVPEDFDFSTFQSWLELTSQTMAARIDNTRRLHQAGVTILAGSDTQSGVFPGAGLHRELHHLVRAGLSPSEAIRAATLDAATFLAHGEEPDFGIIKVGKRADLLLVDGDPSQDVGALEHIVEVILGGVVLLRSPVAVSVGE